MRALTGMVAALVATAFTLVACGIPDEPSVARQAMSSSTSPLTITANLDESSPPAAKRITLSVTGVDNGDWNADQRPDSRVNGFHEVILTPSQPSVTRSFSSNPVAGSVSFDLIASHTEPSREVARVRLSYRNSEGWYFSLPGENWTPFGAVQLGAPGKAGISTTSNPAELIITVSRLP
jgi:hypothetical protein